MGIDHARDIFAEGLQQIYTAAATLPQEQRDLILAGASKIGTAFYFSRNERNDLFDQALTDKLTRIPNRSGVLFDLYGRLEDFKRGMCAGISVVFVDLDGFKAVNDALGHETGDEALRQAAQRLKSGMRKSDLAGRLGGDEMVLVMSHGEDEEFSGQAIRDKVRAALQGLVFWSSDGKPYPIGASIGIDHIDRGDLAHAIQTHTSDLANTMIAQADEKMYKDKPGKAARLAQAAETALAARAQPHHHP